MTRRRWIADTWNADTRSDESRNAALHGDQAQHLIRVLRAQPGMEFDVVAGGRVWLARIVSIENETVHFALLHELETIASLPLTLALSVFKFDRMEWAIEKAVELGCTRIVPLLAQRTEKHLALAAQKRTERWRRLALEAAKQSRRSDLPEIVDPVKLAGFLGSAHTDSPHAAASRRILLAETEEDQSLLQILGSQIFGLQIPGSQILGSPIAGKNSAEPPQAAPSEIVLALGPEGGWTAAELALFAGAGWQSASLGPRILRAETAAIAALAIVGAWHTAGGWGEENTTPSA